MIIPVAAFSAFLLLIVYQSRKIRIYNYGIEGEMKVANLLEQLPNEYIVYNDITIGNNQKGAQVDHLVISPYGLFCIETKNMKGTIIGNENEEYWTQKKRGGGDNIYEKQFYNPCKQSSGHVKSIKYILKNPVFNGVPIYSVVVFTADQETTLHIESRNTPVLKASSILDYIKSKKQLRIEHELIKRVENVVDKNIYSS
ncbi:MAG: nuclease-related domain-containing protein [Bacillota bacterium]|nr:nuclease-related domain-containing protein [Bacillota bacterium]